MIKIIINIELKVKVGCAMQVGIVNCLCLGIMYINHCSQFCLNYSYTCGMCKYVERPINVSANAKWDAVLKIIILEWDIQRIHLLRLLLYV